MSSGCCHCGCLLGRKTTGGKRFHLTFARYLHKFAAVRLKKEHIRNSYSNLLQSIVVFAMTGNHHGLEGKPLRLAHAFRFGLQLSAGCKDIATTRRADR